MMLKHFFDMQKEFHLPMHTYTDASNTDENDQVSFIPFQGVSIQIYLFATSTCL